mmetsp:Transcript_30573/g.76946  ORF Transcript_30573/g.76946 Transcript_30573/m.76946 type:complete len:281 (-) Transcript_30573:267-1109(-)
MHQDSHSHELLQAAANASYNKGLSAIASVQNARPVARTGRALRFLDAVPSPNEELFDEESLRTVQQARTGSTLRTKAARAAHAADLERRRRYGSGGGAQFWGSASSLTGGSSEGSLAGSVDGMSRSEGPRPRFPSDEGSSGNLLAMWLGDVFEAQGGEAARVGESSPLPKSLGNLLESAVGEVGGGIASLFSNLAPASPPVPAADGWQPWGLMSPRPSPESSSSSSPVAAVKGARGVSPLPRAPAPSPVDSVDIKRLSFNKGGFSSPQPKAPWHKRLVSF